MEWTNNFLPIVSNEEKTALYINSDAIVCNSFLECGNTIFYRLKKDWGMHLYFLEGVPIEVNGFEMIKLSAAKINEIECITVKTKEDLELLLVDISLYTHYNDN
ncbi:MAG: hypothetical protein ACFFG0_51455 [Candidatus Thorarchaeota archaeon]